MFYQKIKSISDFQKLKKGLFDKVFEYTFFEIDLNPEQVQDVIKEIDECFLNTLFQLKNHNNEMLSTFSKDNLERVVPSFRVDVADYLKDSFSFTLYRAHEDTSISNINIQLNNLDFDFSKFKNIELTFNKENIELLYPSVKNISHYKNIEHVFINLETEEDFIELESREKLKNQFELIEIYVERKPFIYFSPSLKYRENLDAFVENSFSGPKRVEIDVSNFCTHNCIFCASYNDNAMERHKKNNNGVLSKEVENYLNDKISEEQFENIINSLSYEVQTITFGGVGDPFTHPKIMSFIRDVRLRGIDLLIFTNYAYMNDKKLNELQELSSVKPDSIKVIMNISGASEFYYTTTRPNQKESDFKRIKGSLLKTFELKKDQLKGIDITLMCVVNKHNYKGLEEFIPFANEVGADSVWFKPMELHDETLRNVSIDEKSLEDYVICLSRAIKYADETNIFLFDRDFLLTQLDSLKSKLDSTNIDKILSQTNHDQGVQNKNISNLKNKRTFLYNQNINPIRNKLSNIPPWEVEHKEVVDIASKEIGVLNGNVAADFFSALPCYVANNYIRFYTNGKVTPCCISNFGVSSLNHNTQFSDVWFSQDLYQFRNKLKRIHIEKFHLRQAPWLFCQQCSHLSTNMEYNLKRGFKKRK